MNNANPFKAAVEEIILSKFDGSDQMSLLEQVVEVIIYQSVFTPLIRATLVVADPISLFNHYPLIGEENVTIVLAQESSIDSGKDRYKLDFVISGIESINVDMDNRMAAYNIELVSKEAFLNAKIRVSKCYYENVEKSIEDVLKSYLKSEKKFTVVDPTKITRKLVVPNISPINAIKWFTKYAVSADFNKYYTYSFYESLNGDPSDESKLNTPGFVFKTFQRNSWRGILDESARESAKLNVYIHASLFEAINTLEKPISEIYSDTRLIYGVNYNKRFTTLEKIVGGYFENEYIEVNMHQKDHKRTYFKLSEHRNSLEDNQLDTDLYVNSIVDEDTRNETSAMLRYAINNYDDASQPFIRDKIGSSIASYMAFSQIDVSASVTTDLKLGIGDLFYADLPIYSGFTSDGADEDMKDRYISGYYNITEIKNVFRINGETTTLLRLNKDSYLQAIRPKSDYAR